MAKKKNKKISGFDIYKSVRKSWPQGFSPVTRVKTSAKIYSRKKFNKNKILGGLQ